MPTHLRELRALKIGLKGRGSASAQYHVSISAPLCPSQYPGPLLSTRRHRARASPAPRRAALQLRAACRRRRRRERRRSLTQAATGTSARAAAVASSGAAGPSPADALIAAVECLRRNEPCGLLFTATSGLGLHEDFVPSRAVSSRCAWRSGKPRLSASLLHVYVPGGSSRRSATVSAPCSTSQSTARSRLGASVLIFSVSKSGSRPEAAAAASTYFGRTCKLQYSVLHGVLPKARGYGEGKGRVRA
jgi:hypothetical protein